MSDLVQRERQKLLSAEPGINAHHQHMMNHRKDFDERLDRSSRIDHNPREHPMLLNLLQCAMQMPADLLVNADHVRPGLRELGDEGVRVLDHQMAIERELRHRTQGFHHGRTEGDVRYEVAVHYIDVDDGSAAALCRCCLVSKVGEVGCQYRKCQFNQEIRSCL